MAISTSDFKALKQRFEHKRDVLDQDYIKEWKDISRFISPYTGRFDDRDTQPAKGGQKAQAILNPTATLAKGIAVAGMRGGLVPHSLPWFKFGLEDKPLEARRPVKEWLKKVEDVAYSILSRSNFYSSTHSVFDEQMTYGTGPMLVREHPTRHIHCGPWTAGQYVLTTNDFDEVDTGFRWFRMPVQAVANWFGEENLTESSKNLLEKSPDDYIDVIYAVFPRLDYDSTKSDAVNMPWASLYWEKTAPDGQKPLGESGYRVQPVVFPRWEHTGEDAYGTNCPGITMLPDVKMLQTMERDKLQAVAKVVDPPTMFPQEGGRLSVLPGAKNYVGKNGMDQAKPVYQISPDLNAIAAEIREVETRIRTGFFNDLFLMIINDKNMTATEVAQRHEDKLAILGPVIENQNSEFLTPFIDRLYDIMEFRQLIPPPPEELEGQALKVDYISLLASAQRMVGTQSIEQTVGFVGSIAQQQPSPQAAASVWQKIDIDKAIEHYGDLRGVPPDILKAQDIVDAERAADNAAQQQAALSAQASEGAQTAKTLSETSTPDGNALEQVLDDVVQ